MNNDAIVSSIKQLCKNNNITVTQLEEETGMSQGLVSKWKDKTPSLDKIIDIADYFHVSLDEVVGYNQNIDDEFLKLLCEKTEDGSIKWELGTDLIKQGCKVKLWDKQSDEQILIPKDFIQTIYATKFKTGYIILYSFHYYDNIIQPKELILFIQPSDDRYLVEQHYNTENLKLLWTKILNNLGDNAPDLIKAEDLKNSFIQSNKQNKPIKSKKYESTLQKELDYMIKIDPDVILLLEQASTPEFQKMAETFSNPNYVKHKELINDILKIYNNKYKNHIDVIEEVDNNKRAGE